MALRSRHQGWITVVRVTYISRLRRRRFFMHFCESVFVCEQCVHELHRANPPIATETLTTCHLLITHPSYRPHTHVHLALPPKHPELALTFSNEKGETTRWLITAAEAARLWNSMLLFTSPPVAIMRRTLEGSPALRQLAGGPFFRYNRHKWQWGKQPLFSCSCTDVNGTTSAPNDKETCGGEVYETGLNFSSPRADKDFKYIALNGT